MGRAEYQQFAPPKSVTPKWPWVLCLLALLVFGAVVSKAVLTDSGAVTQSARAFPALQHESIAQIDIMHGIDGVHLRRVGDAWTAERIAVETALQAPQEYPVTPRLIDQAVATLRDLRIGAVTTRDPALHTRYDVGHAAPQLRIYGDQGQLLGHLRLGKAGPDFFSTFVQVHEQPAVYLVPGDLRAVFPAHYRAWQDLTMWQFDPDEVVDVKLETRLTTLHLRKDTDNLFYLLDPYVEAPLSVEQVGAWLRKLSVLRAAGAYEYQGAKVVEGGHPWSELSITLADGTMHELRNFRAANGDAYATIAGVEGAYYMPATVQQLLNASVEDFLAGE